MRARVPPSVGKAGRLPTLSKVQMNKIFERIEREVGVPDLALILANKLSPTDLQSMLLEVYRIRSCRIQPSAILSSFETNRFVQPSMVSPTTLLRWEQIALANLPQEFQPILLSPVCPLDTNSVVAPVDQNWALATYHSQHGSGLGFNQCTHA